MPPIMSTRADSMTIVLAATGSLSNEHNFTKTAVGLAPAMMGAGTLVISTATGATIFLHFMLVFRVQRLSSTTMVLHSTVRRVGQVPVTMGKVGTSATSTPMGATTFSAITPACLARRYCSLMDRRSLHQ